MVARIRGALESVWRNVGLREIGHRIMARLEEQKDVLAIGDPVSPETHAHPPTQRLNVQQPLDLFPRLTTAENVAIPMILKKQPWDEAISKAREYLDVVGLTNRADLPPVKLSGGEQQRVAIARVMDEPTASLDGDTGHGIVTFVKEQILNDKRCVIVVTHDNRIYDLATRILK